jgi:hypothetical protein
MENIINSTEVLKGHVFWKSLWCKSFGYYVLSNTCNHISDDPSHVYLGESRFPCNFFLPHNVKKENLNGFNIQIRKSSIPNHNGWQCVAQIAP